MTAPSRSLILRVGLIVLLLALVSLAAWQWHERRALPVGVLLLQPSAPDAKARAVLDAWAGALAEEGFQATALAADTVERSGLPGRPAGVILPDSALTRLGDKTVAELYRYAREGGRVLVAFDAGTLRAEDGAYSALRSRLSDLVGLSYAEYREQREKVFRSDTLLITPAGMTALAVQPGKIDETALGLELKAYGYEHLNYPMFTTRGPERGTVLARSTQGDAVVTRSTIGEGEVLFMNLPAGYLKTRSDGYLLHQGLRLFMREMAGAAQLLPVPDGIGGLVMNVHIDSGAAVKPLIALEQRGTFKDGPFSLHFTAGPDTYRPGDKTGLDIAHNPWAQDFIRRMDQAGHEIGSHGGWIHNEFGLQADESNAERFEPYLVWNRDSIAGALGRSPVVYSAPVGNQPLWANRWLERNGFVAYYDTGGSGLGPTRAWRDGRRIDATMWSFPVANFKTAATFEDIESTAGEVKHEEETLAYENFTPQMIDYVAAQRVARMTYFHAPAAQRHLDVIDAWLAHAKTLKTQGSFRWYRMDELAAFMSRRETTTWSWDGRTLSASHPTSLAELTWRLPHVQSDTLVLRTGDAQWTQDGDAVLVRAKGGTQLQLGLR